MNEFYFAQQDHQGRRAVFEGIVGFSMKAKLLLGYGPLLYCRTASLTPTQK